ncbi:MAG: 3-phosphoserine/phosphohydroxythreonine transaminase [Flavobacteriales bacterium]
MKKHNFSAGPCILPQTVFKEASESILNFNNMDLSLIEISHRSKDFVEVMSEATSLVKELLNVPEGYSVLFLQGGASLEFLMVAYNLMKVDGKAAYLDTGTWSTKAIKEAKLFGHVDIVASSKDKNYSYIPEMKQLDGEYDYFHCTSNNTIFGTQMKSFPNVNCPLVCDMSSDIFSKTIDVSKFDLIYAGAQKNLGPAGTTLVIVKDEILGKTGREIPSMLDYKTHISKDSMFNTPPVFSVYVSMLTLRWLKENGGVEWIENLNKKKAELLYSTIDNSSIFNGSANIKDRSTMNATFLLNDNNLESEFLSLCDKNGINGLKGHRSVGGYRASMYNALPLKSVQVLTEIMNQLEK